MKDAITRICLWSGPRNVSTALMYSFAQRADTKVFDEPLYGHYLKNTEAKFYHPMADLILSEMENDGEKVVKFMQECDKKPVLFFKQMTHHLVKLDWSFLKDMQNIILTRDPIDMLPSYAKEIENPTMADVGYAMHSELFEYLDNLGQRPIVLDSRRLLENPEKVLKKLCTALSIPFDKAMLSWPAGAISEDGVWADHWYGSVHASTGFQEYKPKAAPFPEGLKPLLEDCQKHYRRLAELSIQ